MYCEMYFVQNVAKKANHVGMIHDFGNISKEISHPLLSEVLYSTSTIPNMLSHQ